MQCLAEVLALVILAVANCANVPIEGRIIGGSQVNICDFPYQVSVQANGQHICGGAILNSNTIITAAHCTEGQVAKTMSIRHGSPYTNYGGKRHQVRQIIEHPGYNPNIMVNDVALLKIISAIRFTKSSQPVKLAKERLPDNSSAVIAGWGSTSEKGGNLVFFKRMNAVTVPTVNQDECAKDFPREIINEYVMCAGALGKDNCAGDSGGPLVAKDTKLMVGLSSWGYGCGRKEYPGVYTSIPEVSKFIEIYLNL